MKRFIVVAVILICCLVYAIIKLSMSENQYAYNQAEETQSAKHVGADNTDKAIPEEGPGSTVPAVQVEAVTKPEEDSVSPASAVQVEAVTKVFSEFQSAIKSEDYEQAWKLMSESSKSRDTFEKFEKEMADEGAVFVAATIHPESAINIEGRVGLLVTNPSHEQGIYFLFNQEDGQWKLHDVRSAESVDTSKE